MVKTLHWILYYSSVNRSQIVHTVSLISSTLTCLHPTTVKLDPWDLIFSCLGGITGQSITMIDKACPIGTMLICYLSNRWLIGSVSIATATGLWQRATGSLVLKKAFLITQAFSCPLAGLHSYTDPLCALRVTTYNTVIDGGVQLFWLKDRGQLKLCRMTIHCPSHARCLTV